MNRQSATEATETALTELTKIRKPIPWFRFCVTGSLPQPSQAKKSKRFVAAIKALFRRLAEEETPTHVQLETRGKAEYYRSISDTFLVDSICVRESAQTLRRFYQAITPVSISVGTRDQSRRKRLQAARRVAKHRRRHSGRKCIVCPAIATHFLRGKPHPRAKCGDACTMCARDNVDVVFPLH